MGESTSTQVEDVAEQSANAEVHAKTYILIAVRDIHFTMAYSWPDYVDPRQST